MEQQISFSGGRSSAMMLRMMIDNGEANGAQIVFANTGREMPETLDFVEECGQRWGVPIVWVEYRDQKPFFEVVNHNSASRDGEPFSALVRKRKFLPNSFARFCTSELKVLAAQRYLKSLGWYEWRNAIGIRSDEAHRAHDKDGRVYPLIQAGVTKADVTAFWGRQPFNLRLPIVEGASPYGNCDGCFLKSEAFLAGLARDKPERHAWWERLEDEIGGEWRSRYARRDLRSMIERQGDWLFDIEGALCQANDGECVA